MSEPDPFGKMLIASSNTKKAAEMAAILQSAGLGLSFLTLADFPDAAEVEETGETFLANAVLKARAGAALSGLPTIADDGGLCIDALGGNPGVHSHRFLGASTSFPEKMSHILKLMEDVGPGDRTCRFQCAVAIAFPDGRCFECEGTCEGSIGHDLRGSGGFGYDPIFCVDVMGRHMAELTQHEKSLISHRGKALACAIDILKRCNIT